MKKNEIHFVTYSLLLLLSSVSVQKSTECSCETYNFCHSFFICSMILVDKRRLKSEMQLNYRKIWLYNRWQSFSVFFFSSFPFILSFTQWFWARWFFLLLKAQSASLKWNIFMQDETPCWYSVSVSSIYMDSKFTPSSNTETKKKKYLPKSKISR